MPLVGQAVDHGLVQPLAGEPLALIGVAWKKPVAHAVHTMSDDADGAVA